MDPQRARLMATAIAEELARADSSHAIGFGDRASTLDASLAALDKEIEARTATLSAREVAPLPSTMAYFAERYALRPRKVAPGQGSAAVDGLFDPLGGTGAKIETYEDLIRFDTAALEGSMR